MSPPSKVSPFFAFHREAFFQLLALPGAWKTHARLRCLTVSETVGRIANKPSCLHGRHQHKPVYLPVLFFRVTWTQAHVTRNSHPTVPVG